MSTRTIIELNHDYAHSLREMDMELLMRRILTTSLTGALNKARGRPVDLVPGMRVMAQRHHSEKITLEFS